MLKVLKLFPIFSLFFFLFFFSSFKFHCCLILPLYIVSMMLSVHNKRFSCVLYAGILYINFNCWQKIIENHFVQYKKYFNIYSNFYDAIRLLLYIRYIFCNHWPRCSHIWTGKSDILLFRALSRDFHASEASCWSRQMVWLQSYSDQKLFFFF